MRDPSRNRRKRDPALRARDPRPTPSSSSSPPPPASITRGQWLPPLPSPTSANCRLPPLRQACCPVPSPYHPASTVVYVVAIAPQPPFRAASELVCCRIALSALHMTVTYLSLRYKKDFSSYHN